MRGRFVELGCALTVICWLAAAMLSLGPIMGDCSPVRGAECPTDHQRDMKVLEIVLGAAAANIGGLFVLGYRTSGDERIGVSFPHPKLPRRLSTHFLLLAEWQLRTIRG
jgi:hypothetical protein